MRIQNITKKRLIEAQCKPVNPFIGLMFQRPHPVLFRFRHARSVSLHMFFVWGAIDVLFVRENRVVDIKKDFGPWRLYASKAPADLVIELPAGQLKGVAIGDKLLLS